MKKFFLIALGLSMGLFSCIRPDVAKSDSDSSRAIVAIEKDTIRKAEVSHELAQFTTDDCNQLLNRLFQSSSFESAFAKKELLVSVDGVKDSIVSIKVESKESSGLTVGWVNLDLSQRKMADITNDPEAPVILKFNDSMLDSLLTGCTFRDTE